MHGSSGGGARKRARIEIIPLIDIMFFLVATLFMVSLAMTKNQGMALALPSASTGESQGSQAEQDKAVTLSVNEKGEVFFNKEKITAAQLPLRLQTYKTNAKDPKVSLNGDARVDYQHLAAVLDEVRKAGIYHIVLNTKSE